MQKHIPRPPHPSTRKNGARRGPRSPRDDSARYTPVNAGYRAIEVCCPLPAQQLCHSEERVASFAATRNLLWTLRRAPPLKPFAVILSAAKNLSCFFWLSLCAFALVLVLVAAAPARATIRYEVSLAHPERHQFHVTMTVANFVADTVVQMPAWNALYEIRDFGARVTDLRAADSSDIPLAVQRLDKNTWRVEVSNRPLGGQGGGPHPVRDFWDEPGPFDTQLDGDHAFSIWR